jgi:hypothetical protein
VSHLVKTYPSLLDAKTAYGATPLFLACRLGRIDIVKILLEAGADQTTKDFGRNTLLHAALDWKPSAKKLKALLNLLDSGLLATALKERNRLEDSGRTPLHQWLDGVATGNGYTTAAAVRVFKLLVDISHDAAKQALRMPDGTGDTPLHSLLAKRASVGLVRAVVSFDPSLLFCENAVGRTPAEVAHDRFLSDRFFPESPRYYWAPYEPDVSVSTLVSKSPSDFVKKPSCDQAREHESKTNVANNWRLCAEFMAQVEQPKRTLVSLHSANFVAARLGEQYMRTRYRFSLGKTTERDTDSVSSEDIQNGNAGESKDLSVDKGKVLFQRPRHRGTDVISERWHSRGDAWTFPKKESDDDNVEAAPDSSDDSDADHLCDCCGRSHN